MKRHRHRGLQVVYVQERQNPMTFGFYGCIGVFLALGMLVLFFLLFSHLASGRPW